MGSKELDKDLLAALNTVKTGAGKTKLQFAACPAKPAWKLVVAKTVSQKQKDELKKSAGASTVLAGEVTFEDGKITFVSDGMKQGLAKNLKLGVKAASGKAFPVRGRNEDGSLVDDPDAGGGKGVTTMDFGDEEGVLVEVPVAHGDPGIPSEQQIVNQLQKLRDGVQDYWSNYGDGLDNFFTRMAFSSEQEAEPQYLNTSLKALGNFALDKVIEVAGDAAYLGGVWGAVIAGAKELVTAWVAEKERVETAKGQARVADYIVAVRNGIGPQRQKMTEVIDAAKGKLLAKFQEVAANDFSRGEASRQGVVVGDAAQILIDLTELVDAFEKAIPAAQNFEQQISKNFADVPGLTDYISHGGRPSGTLYFHMDLYVQTKDGVNEWSVKDADDEWTLATTAPQPERIAASLAGSLEGKKPWQIELPKMVQFTIEIEESGLNSYQDGSIYFTKSPDSYQVRSNYSPKWFEAAWSVPQIRKHPLNVSKLTGSGE